MSWFKKRSESKNSQRSSDASSLNSEGAGERRSRCDTDPETCLEVFRNHWEQAYKIIKRDANNGGRSSVDEVEAVSQNFEQMVTLLADEEGEDGQGMPGPILHYLLEHEILEKFCGWCHKNNDETGKLTKEQLRMFEHLISQSNQLLLIHKPVIRPLLNLLAYCADGFSSAEIEPHLVLVLHQVCVSISKEAVILESFFNMNADHGPTRFLIFSLLIPFLHREGKVGQQARDALLLIMTLSAKHPYIGEYIAENSDFCPVLATGLSGLYSDLPRKFYIPSEDWVQLTDDDVQRVPEMVMFLNSLEFCNAVAQIAQPLVRDQLIKYIYNGFLVPVMGPALHQNSREEVITATAYLDLFLRKISEASLIKAFLMFIFTEKNDEIVILDSLITRLHSSSKLCQVSLSLFYTLVDLNCEDVMFELVFKHLIPCTHVMVSQRRSLKDQDIYCKSVEKFLSLRPTCCLPEIESPKHGSGDAKVEPTLTGFPSGSFGSKLEHFETSYLEYLRDAHTRQQKCARACQVWEYPYDGENPKPTCLDKDANKFDDQLDDTVDKTSENSEYSPREDTTIVIVDKDCRSSPLGRPSSDAKVRICDSFRIGVSAIDNSEIYANDISRPIGDGVGVNITFTTEKDFISMLEESDSPTDKSVNVEESLKTLDVLLSSLSLSKSRTSTPRKDVSQDGDDEGYQEFPSDFGDESELSTVYYDCETSRFDCDNETFKSVNDTSFELIATQAKSKTTNATEFEILDSQQSSVTNNTELQGKTANNLTSFVDISAQTSQQVSKSCEQHEIVGDSVVVVERIDLASETSAQSGDKPEENSGEEKPKSERVKGDKSVRFAAGPPEAFSPVAVGSTSSKQPSSPSIGPFLTALMTKLDGMMQNSLSVNLMLTGLIARLAVFPQPLLRSFLLNHTLVFQPTVKSLVQVLTTVRQKVDHYSYTVQNFEALLLRARRTLAQREGLLPERGSSLSPSPEMVHTRMKANSVLDIPSKEKRHRTLSELLFRRTPNERKAGNQGGKGTKIEILAGNKGMRYINKREDKRDSQQESLKTRHAVYCAIVLEEFVKELAALTQEHTVLYLKKE